jgi:serine/threonine protein kinase
MRKHEALEPELGRDPSVQKPAVARNSIVTREDTGAPEPVAAPGPGTRIQHYELIRELGAGGMGTVFLARDMRLGRRVAIKFLQAEDPQLTQRFLLEAQATARCSHENIVIIHEVGEYQGSPFMVLEYLQGQPLTKLIKGQRLPAGRAVELMVPVVRALACAHEHKIVHRDLKPDNIFVTEAGTLKVLDFGIAKVLRGDAQVSEVSLGLRAAASAAPGDRTDLTRSGVIVGTMAYMSPEQWGIGVPVDHRTDIWAVGIILFRMLAGRHPLDPLRGPQLVVTAELDTPMPKLRDVAPDVPTELAAVVDCCLRKQRDERFPDALALLRALEPFLPGRATHAQRVDESPYAGLSSFQEEDADRFFGREREVAAVMHRLHDRPLLGVVGPSGAGKSSFVRAGLVPELKRSGEAWESLVIRPGRNPLGALANVVSPLVKSSDSLEDDIQAQQSLAERLRTQPGYVGAVLRSRARREGRKILLFVDQFEELYTQVPDVEERRAFTACLSGMADDATSPLRVVVSLRSDFLDRVSEDEHFLSELSQGLYFLNAPQRDGLKDALVLPAERAGYRFETPEMVAHMLAHLEATQGALPLLQFAAMRLWETRDPARRLLTQSAYTEMGGISGALATHADRVLTGMTAPERALVRSVFLRLVTPERTRALVSVGELRELSKDSGELQRLIDHLVQARLLVVQTGEGEDGATVEIVHESLLQGWPTLKRWLEEGQEDAAFLEQLRTAARQWKAKEYDRELLWRGEMVEEARRFQRRYRGELPELQQQYLEAVFSESARSVKRKRALMVGSTAFLLLLVVAAGVALVIILGAKKEAEAAQMLAVAEKLRAEKNEQDARRAEQTARKAEEAAQRNLEEVKAKELERRKVQAELEKALEEIQIKNRRLVATLKKAEEAEERARSEKSRAEKSAKAARQARARALRAAEELEKALEREKKRVEGLQGRLKELGDPVFIEDIQVEDVRGRR